MKRIIFVIITLCLFQTLSAQGNKGYYVYSVTGQVTSDGEAVRPGQMIRTAQTIDIPRYGQLTLLDEKGKRLYSFHSPGRMKLSAMMNDKKTSVTELTGNYLRYIKDQMFASADSKPKPGMAKTGGYRGEEEDALFMSSLFGMLKPAEGAAIQETLRNTGDVRALSGYDVILDLSVLGSGEFGRQAYSERVPYVACITNRSETLLFVNILHIDADGNCSLLLKADSMDGFSNYLVPPQSTILFEKDPFVIIDADEDSFILLATSFPINFNMLTTPAYSAGKAKGGLRIGLDRLTIR